MGEANSVREELPLPVLHLGWDGEERFEVDANVLATGRTCIVGASGSGKSYAVSVVCEELCKEGVPFAIIDTEGEHSGLKEKYEAVWIGEDDGCDLRWPDVDLARLARQAPDIAPLVLDVSETEGPRERVNDFVTNLYKEVERRRTPYLLVVEEADRFIPQNGERLAILGEVARRGRKRGLGLVVCTQRPSLVDKNVLSQCGNQLIGRLVIRNDLQSVSQFFSGRDLPRYLTTLPPGRFYAMGGLSAMARLITIRRKETRYGGGTPRLGPRIVKPLGPDVVAALGGGAKPVVETGGGVGINPSFRPEEIPRIVKRDRSFVFFGKEEVVADAQLVYRPIVEVGVSMRTGVLKKRIRIRYTLLDGETGRLVELRETPVFREGFERLLGLSVDEIEVLQVTRSDRDMSILEVANRIGVSKESLRRPIRVLERKRLIRSFQLGRSRVFRRLFSFPDIPWNEVEQAVERLDDPHLGAEERKLEERDVREVFRGVIHLSDIQSYRRFLYPLYRVELARSRRKRIVWLDGRSGKEIHL